jgi:predicted DNA-binding ribbon-helix-helix protein
MALASPRRAPRSGADPSSSLSPHNVIVGGRRTSVRLEASMWEGLHDIARRRAMTLNELVTEIERNRVTPGLTAAIRVYIVDFYRTALGAITHAEIVDRRA